MSMFGKILQKGAALFTNAIKSGFQNSYLLGAASVAAPVINQTRNVGYLNRMMLKDIKRRELVRKYAMERIKLQTLAKNTILPKPVKEVSREQLQSLTPHSTLFFLNDRCVVTSKPGGVLSKWRLSRIVWRLLADYNQMSGVTRAKWGVPTRNSICFTYKKNQPTWFDTERSKALTLIDRGNVKRTYRFRFV